MNKNFICFDLYNTLITSTKTGGSAYEDVLVRLGVKREDIFPFVRDQIMTKDLTIDEVITMLFLKFDIDPQQHVNEFEEAKYLWNSDNACRWMDGTLELLEELKERPNTYLGLSTNVTRVGWDTVDALLSIAEKFDDCFLSWKEGMVKPEKACWLGTLERLGLTSVDPAQCWMIGDRDTDDLSTPRAMGWKTFLVSPDGSDIPRLRETLLKVIE